MKNPFILNSFTSCWIKHFNRNISGHFIYGLKPLSFVQHKLFPYFVNTGTRFTKGITYNLNHETTDDGLGVAMIYDVLTYEQSQNQPLPNNIGLMISKQYPGYLIDLKGYASLQEFLQKKFSKSSRYKLTKYKKRLETAFDIRYVMYWGDMDKAIYDQLFVDFRELLEKRFDDKQETNNNLAPEEWHFFTEVAYPMILEKSAGLFVVYDGATPIAVTLNFLSDTTVFDAITVFDIDYTKFHLGSVSVMGLIDWCISNGMEILDFSKGEYDYKKRWATLEYYFEYHVLYNKKSLSNRLIAWLIVSFFSLKQKLRDWKVNDWLHRFTFWLRNKRTQQNKPKGEFSLQEINDEGPEVGRKVEMGSPEFEILRRALFEFLFLYSEDSKDTVIYQLQDNKAEYLVKGAANKVILRFSSN